MVYIGMIHLYRMLILSLVINFIICKGLWKWNAVGLVFQQFDSIFTNINLIQSILISIHIHTNKNCVDGLFNSFHRYRKDYPFIKYYLVNSNKFISPFPEIGTITANCSDFADVDEYLVCQDVFSNNHFLDHPNDGDWLFRATVDTFIDIDNLINLISNLQRIYNPKKEIVFRGFQNYLNHSLCSLDEISGWLCSREMVKLQNTARFGLLANSTRARNEKTEIFEASLVKKIFGTGNNNVKHWNEPLLTNFNLCDFNNDLQSIQKCGNVTDVYPLADGVSFHMHCGGVKNISIHFNKSRIYFYKTITNQITRLCMSPENVGFRDTIEYMKENAKHITINSVTRKKRRKKPKKKKSLMDIMYQFWFFFKLIVHNYLSH